MNRPQWQASLRAVADVRDDAWTDVTLVPGLRPRMRTLVSEAPYRWAEEGRWGKFRARLELILVPAAEDTCTVTARFAVRGLGLGPLLTRLAAPAVAADLRRAARYL